MSDTLEAEAKPVKDGLTGAELNFVGQLLTTNAAWSADIHNRALDGQERASNEWAQRYLNLVIGLERILDTTKGWERDTRLFERLNRTSAMQSFYPHQAAEQIARYEERLERRNQEAADRG